MERIESGLAELLPPLPTPTAVRTLWRMQGPSRIIVARLERHPYGRELVIAFEGADNLDVLETRFERFDVSSLNARSDELRELLTAKGWAEIRRLSK